MRRDPPKPLGTDWIVPGPPNWYFFKILSLGRIPSKLSHWIQMAHRHIYICLLTFAFLALSSCWCLLFWAISSYECLLFVGPIFFLMFAFGALSSYECLLFLWPIFLLMFAFLALSFYRCLLFGRLFLLMFALLALSSYWCLLFWPYLLVDVFFKWFLVCVCVSVFFVMALMIYV